MSTEEIEDAMQMLGAGYDHPAIEIEPQRTVIERRSGRMQEIERAAFVKISTAFKPEMKNIDEIALKVWLYIALSVNRFSGNANPGLRTIAAECNLAINTVRAAIDRLENEYELLTVHRGSKKYNIYEPVMYVSANKTVSADDTVTDETVSADDTVGHKTVSDSDETVSAKCETVSPRVILNQRNQNKQDICKTFSGSDWGIAAGISSEQIAKDNAIIENRVRKCGLYEKHMGYRNYNWGAKGQADLADFISGRSDDEIVAFSEWSNAEFSPFNPVKAKSNPKDVEMYWDIAMKKASYEPKQHPLGLQVNV